jgi:hypothetical protein
LTVFRAVLRAETRRIPAGRKDCAAFCLAWQAGLEDAAAGTAFGRDQPRAMTPLSTIDAFLLSVLSVLLIYILIHPLPTPASSSAGRAPSCGGIARPKGRHVWRAQPPRDGILPACPLIS